MCTRSPKVQSAEPQKPPDPAPPPPTPTEAMVTQADSKKVLDRMRFGLASTIKTGPRGVLTDSTEQKKQKLGA